jgi:hypothetical protein
MLLWDELAAAEAYEVEELSVAIYHQESGQSVLYDNCTQPMCQIKTEEPWFPVFCACGHTYIVPVNCSALCVRCRRDNADSPFALKAQSSAPAYRYKTVVSTPVTTGPVA